MVCVVLQTTVSSLSLMDSWSVAPARTLKEESDLTVVRHIVILAVVELFNHILFCPLPGHTWKGLLSHPFRHSEPCDSEF